MTLTTKEVPTEPAVPGAVISFNTKEYPDSEIVQWAAIRDREGLWHVTDQINPFDWETLIYFLRRFYYWHSQIQIRTTGTFILGPETNYDNS